MADLFFIHSNNHETVDHVCAAVKHNLQILTPGCKIDQFDGTKWSLITGRNPVVPYVTSCDPCGAAVVIGSTYTSTGPKVTDLRQPLSKERIKAIRAYCRQLNFGVVLSIKDEEVLVTTDWLGLYPIYYYYNDSTFIVTSIPNLINCHSGFRPVLDIQGLVGILLLAHSSLGFTLFKDVSRLQAGHFLKYIAGVQMTLDDVPLGTGIISPKNMDEAVEAFDAQLSDIIGSVTHDTTQSIYLSGGLDSRIVAGYLHQFSLGELTAITMGDRRDLEMRAAARAASAIGSIHRMIPIDQSNDPIFAQQTINQDMMSSGLYTLNEWSFSEVPHEPVLTGFHGDPIMGASQGGWGREPSCDLYSFNAAFISANSSGLSPGIIRELVRSNDIDDIIFDFLRQLREEYYSYPGQPWQQAWWFDLHHRQRFLIGRLPKIMALRSWPVLPFVYPPIIQLAVATPLSILSDRKVQIELVQRKFPKLARLPLARDIDRKWYTIIQRKNQPWTPIVARVKNSILWYLHDRFNHSERLVFARTFDFNGVGWKILRDKARALSRETDFCLNKNIVLKLIPPSSKEAILKRVISDATGRKALIGCILCCYQYFTNQK